MPRRALAAFGGVHDGDHGTPAQRPPEVTTVAQLLDWLKGRGPGYAEALEDVSALRVAVNQEYARPGDPVGPDDEVALFPPVTGG